MFKECVSRVTLRLIVGLSLVLVSVLIAAQVEAAAQTDIAGPPGSGQFGSRVTALPNGNFVVTDPLYDAGATADVGAAYLYNGATLTLISQLTGSTANDRVGSHGVLVLANGNYIVRSQHWTNGAATDAGAVTWCSKTGGCSGAVSLGNSLVGSQAGDAIGRDGVVALSNGNFVVQSPAWHNGAAADAGAVTWCSGTAPCAGAVSPVNSLVGSQANDSVGFYPDRVIELSDGNYVVPSPFWANGAAAKAGAVTWCSGTSGCRGPVSVANSLVGTQANNEVGGDGAVALLNGTYGVLSPKWDNGTATDVGAVTRCGGAADCLGAVSPANSLVGSRAFDSIGLFGVTVLMNGSYVVNSYWWDNATAVNAGAVTWCSETSGCSGVVSPDNSLVGSKTNDQVGYGGVTELTNGKYVVTSLDWNSQTAAKVGAVTLCSGTSGCTGPVSPANSLVGSIANDQVGFSGVTALTNGNYVVDSMYWDNAAAVNAGAVTWCSGTGGCTGAVTTTNSLVGSQANDQVGSGARSLTNGDYVVSSPNWANGSATKAGASTRCSGTIGCSGAVTTANSLTGSRANDKVGNFLAVALPNGSYVTRSPEWANGSTLRAGAVTWCDGTSVCTGAVTSANSLVGSQANDQIGDYVTVLTNGSYVVSSVMWDNGAAADAGAVTGCSGSSGCTGPVNTANSLVGSRQRDWIGNGWTGVRGLVNGTYVVLSPSWDNGGTVDSGAVTWVFGAAGTPTGPITGQNSVLGTAASGGPVMNIAYDELHRRLYVGRPADNKVTVVGVTMVYLPLLKK